MKTRQRMRQDLFTNLSSQQNFAPLVEHSIENDDRISNFNNILKTSSVGASSIATASDSPELSPISSSPPLSSGCKRLILNYYK